MYEWEEVGNGYKAVGFDKVVSIEHEDGDSHVLFVVHDTDGKEIASHRYDFDRSYSDFSIEIDGRNLTLAFEDEEIFLSMEAEKELAFNHGVYEDDTLTNIYEFASA